MVTIMKKISILCFAALAMVACNKNDYAPQTSQAELFAVNDEASVKTHLENMSVLWDNGDAINVFAQGQSYKFATSESGASVKFKGEGITIDNSVYTLFPYIDGATFSAGTFNLPITSDEQKVVNGTFTASRNIAVGQCDNDKKVSFKSIGALLKFKLGQAGADTLKRIEIKSNGGEPLAINGAASVNFNGGDPTITPLDGAVCSDKIVLTPSNGKFASGDTYYVWVLPGNYAKGITITLVTPTLMIGEKAGTSALNIARNQIVDLDEIKDLVYKKKSGETKTLTFDFSTCPTGWPSGSEEYKSTDHSEKTHAYVLGGETYNFTSATCLGIKATSTRSICWGYDGTNVQDYYVMQAERYFGMPTIAGWKLITIKFTQACSSNTGRKACVTTEITTQSNHSAVLASGGEVQVVGTQGTEYAFYLSDTKENHRYYLAPTAKATGFATMTLIYEKVE